jgi:hypothetical protein
MKSWAAAVAVGAALLTASACLDQAPPTEPVPMPEPPPPAPAAKVQTRQSVVRHGFAGVASAFQRGAVTEPDRIGEAEAKRDDRDTTRADTVPAGAPREL